MGHITRLRRRRQKRLTKAFSKNIRKAIEAGQVNAIDVLGLYLEKGRKITMKDISLIKNKVENGNKKKREEEE